jgi:signal transduction histidine kinase
MEVLAVTQEKNTGQVSRKTGINALGSVAWGTHVCLFYRAKEDLIKILVPYFKAGLENNEFCMWITSNLLDPTEAKNAMKKTMPDFDKYLRKGQIEILPHDQWYLDHGIFDKERVIKDGMDKLNEALLNGYAGMRVTGDTAWLDKRTWKAFNDYENEINAKIDKYDMVAVCTYSLDQCEAAEIVDVANAHQLALVGKRREWRLVKNAERKRAQQRAGEYQAQLKSLALQSSLAEEREKHRIATELHDQIGQSLAISKVKLDALHHSVLSGERGEVLEEVCNALGQAIAQTRSLTFDLSSPILHELGLEAAIDSWLAEQIEAKYHISTEFVDDGQPKPLDDDVRALLFRNVRELLMNVVRHANASKAKVSVWRADNQMHISVQDDGVGFEPAEALAKGVREGKYGLFSVKERLEQLGGRVEIESAPDRGCKVTMTVPLKQDGT